MTTLKRARQVDANLVKHAKLTETFIESGYSAAQASRLALKQIAHETQTKRRRTGTLKLNFAPPPVPVAPKPKVPKTPFAKLDALRPEDYSEDADKLGELAPWYTDAKKEVKRIKDRFKAALEQEGTRIVKKHFFVGKKWTWMRVETPYMEYNMEKVKEAMLKKGVDIEAFREPVKRTFWEPISTTDYKKTFGYRGAK